MIDVLLGIAGGLLVSWLALIVVLAVMRPKGNLFNEALRLLPDMLRLLRDLARDPTLPRGVRVRLGLLVAYLAMPLDLVPDFIPVIGYADDVIIASLVLRSVVRRAGLDEVRRRWTGTDDGFATLCRVCRLAGLARVGLAHGLEHAEDLADVVVAFERMAQRKGGVELVAVAAALAVSLQVAIVDELGHDALRCAFGDADGAGHVSQAHLRVASQAQQDVGVVREERPIRHPPEDTRCATRFRSLIGRLATGVF